MLLKVNYQFSVVLLNSSTQEIMFLIFAFLLKYLNYCIGIHTIDSALSACKNNAGINEL